jgi:hypothetical protein
VRVRPTILFLVLAVAATGSRAGTSTEDARAAAATFGRALTSAQASSLRPILPQRGKVHLALVRLGPEDGVFGASQVEAVFRDFLAAGSVATYEVVRCESDGKSAALAHARATITDRDGRRGAVALHLGFQPEDGRWVLREVKESAE